MAGSRMTPGARYAAGAAALAAVLLMALVLVHLAGRRGPAPETRVPRPAVEEGPVDRKDKVLHREFVGGRPAAEIRADRYFQDQAGLRHLEGEVEVRDFGPDGSTLSRITADGIVYDRDLTRFEISGRVTVSVDGLVLEGGYFEYDKAAGVFGTRRGATFSTEAMSGQAAAVTYDRGRDQALLSGGFRVVLEEQQTPRGERSVLSGEMLSLLRRSRSGEAAGGVRFARGPVEGASEALSFVLAPGERSFVSMTFSGGAKVSVAAPTDGLPEAQTLEAEAVVFVPPAAPGADATLEARGSVRATLASPEGERARLMADSARLTFNEAGEATGWTAQGGFVLEVDGRGGGARTMTGARAERSPGTGVITVGSAAGRPAVIDEDRVRIEAAAIRIGSGGRELDASGDVKCLFKPGRGEGPSDFFSPEVPLYVSARTMARREDAGKAVFEGRVRAWQEGRTLAAGELGLDEGSGAIQGKGGVTVTLPGPSKDGRDPGPVESGGEVMSWSPDRRELSFRGRAFIRLTRARLTAEEIVAVLGPEDGGLERMTGQGGVVVARNGYEGRGGEVRYEASADRIELSGRPVLVDRDGRVSRGSKLTFDLGDDRIRLENEGQGRSVTVIRS